MVTVNAQIADVGQDTYTTEWHQHIYVQVQQVLDDGGGTAVAVGQRVHVAIHYGDSLGLPAAVPNLQAGQTIELRGKYVPLSQAYPSPDGETLPVIHFTHHPLGWVIYQGVRYE